MRKKKWISVFLTLAMTASLLAGCGGSEEPAAEVKEEVKQETTAAETETEAGTEAEAASAESEGPDISEYVELTMYCIGDEGSIYADDALDNLNAILKEKINATIKPMMVSWGEYREKMPLIYASGEAYDLTYVANWINYFDEAQKGPFMELTDLMQTYAPLTYAELNESGVLDTAKVNGELFMVPSTVSDFTMFNVVWREDLRKKYDCPEIVDYETLEIFMDTIKENEPDMLPMAFAGSESFLKEMFLNEHDMGRTLSDQFITYNIKEGTEYFHNLENPDYIAYLERQHRWYEKGFWSKNVLSETMPIKDSFKAGRSATATMNKSNLLSLITEIQASNPDWELGYHHFDESGTFELIPPTNNGISIGINSKNPERAMMFLELMNQDEEAFRAMYYGIEGVTYVIDEAGRKDNPEGEDPANLGLRNLGMGMQNGKFILDKATDDEDALAYFEEMEKTAVMPELAGFAFDDSAVAAEVAAMNNISKEFGTALDFGVVDPATGLPEMYEKLKEAGIDKVLDEMNRQLVEYNAARGK